MNRFAMLVSAAFVAAGAAVASQSAGVGQVVDTPQFARPTPDGKTLVVPEADRAKGQVYYALTGRDRQVYFESDAPLEDIKGQSNRVIGYAVLSGSPAGALAAGEWHLPVSSMRTGIELRDEHLAGKDWLDAESHPNIVVQLRGVKDVEQTKQTAAFTTYTQTLVVDLSLHGVTRRVEIPGATVTLLPESEATRRVAPGDLMAVRAKFGVTLADYDVSHPVIGDKVAETVQLDVSLYLSTLPPRSRQ